MRVSEVVALKIGDIDSKRMIIRVEQGKGRKDRYVSAVTTFAQTAGGGQHDRKAGCFQGATACSR